MVQILGCQTHFSSPVRNGLSSSRDCLITTSPFPGSFLSRLRGIEDDGTRAHPAESSDFECTCKFVRRADRYKIRRDGKIKMNSMKRVLVAAGLSASSLVAGGTVAFSAATAASATSVKNCVPSQITVTHGSANGAAGTVHYPIVFTNTGATCAIFGVPAVQPVAGSAHHVVGPLARSLSMGEMPVRHVIAKGQSVSVAFGVTEAGNFTPSTCVMRSANGVVVTLGTFVSSRYVHLPIVVCTKRTSITTRLITAGVTGS